MKTTYLILFVIIILAVTSCDIDNYEAPQVTITGKIVDSATGELVESGGINAGSVIKFYQDNSTQPLIYNTLPDGTFVNSRVFEGTYTYVAEGPFTMAENNTAINVGGDMEMEVEVVPNLRLGLSVVPSGANSATVTLTYEKLAVDQDLVNLGVVWSKYPNPNSYTFAGGAIDEDNVQSLDLTTGEMVFEIEGLQTGSTYYLRGIGRTSNPGKFYNYSTTIEVKAE